MGTINHNAIVVTSYRMEELVSARDRAVDLGCQVIGPSEPAMNAYASLLVCPDGSKEHWPDSEAGDVRRAKLREWLSRKPSLAWAEVSFGEYGASVIDTSEKED